MAECVKEVGHVISHRVIGINQKKKLVSSKEKRDSLALLAIFEGEKKNDNLVKLIEFSLKKYYPKV